jgi:hypothetical protein
MSSLPNDTIRDSYADYRSAAVENVNVFSLDSQHTVVASVHFVIQSCPLFTFKKKFRFFLCFKKFAMRTMA